MIDSSGVSKIGKVNDDIFCIVDEEGIRGSCTILISKFKEFSRTIQGPKQTFSKRFKYKKMRHAGSPKYRKRDVS